MLCGPAAGMVPAAKRLDWHALSHKKSATDRGRFDPPVVVKRLVLGVVRRWRRVAEKFPDLKHDEVADGVIVRPTWRLFTSWNASYWGNG